MASLKFPFFAGIFAGLALSVGIACGPVASCGPSTCLGGCCDASGQCVVGTSDSQCGSAGQLCQFCPAGTFCDGSRSFTCAVRPSSGSGVNGQSNSSDGGIVPPFGVALRVVAAKQLSTMGSSVASTGTLFVPVTLEVGNGNTKAIAVGAEQFRFRASNLEYSGDSYYTGTLADGCPGSAQLAPKSSITCTVVFQLPQAAHSGTVLYGSEDGGSTGADVTIAPCSLCDGRCVDLKTDPNNCGACGAQAVPACYDGHVPVAKSSTNPQLSCKQICGTSTCRAAAAQYYGSCGSEVTLPCEDVPNTSINSSSCGTEYYEGSRCTCAG